MREQDYIEGRNPVLEAIKSGREIEKILIAKGSNQGSIRKIVAMAKTKGIVIQHVDKNKIEGLSTTHAHQGVVAMVASYAYKTVEDILEAARKKEEDPFIIILDEITDPHNLGSIIRTAECGGVHGVVIPKRRSAGLTAIVSKTSAGAIEYMPVAKVSNIAATVDKLKKEGVWIYGADMDGEVHYFETDFKGPVALVIGSEGKGISRLIKEKCDFLSKIPMMGRVTSLNASVAASLMIYEVVRQRSRVR